MTPNPREPLSLDRVVAAAVAIADAEGAPAVTMRKLATVLDCEAMSLYHYVPSKSALMTELANYAVERVVEVSVPVTGADWADTVRLRCLAARTVMLTHPWAPALILDETQAPMASWALFESLVGTLYDAGFDDYLAHRAIHALGSMVFGFSTELFEPDAGGSAEPDEETMAMLAAHMPHLMRLAAAVSHDGPDTLGVCDTQAEFEFTLRLVLEGLERERLGGSTQS